MSAMYGIQTLNFPNLHCKFKKAETKKDFSHNIIRNTVFFDLDTNNPVDVKQVKEMKFRKKLYEELTEESLRKNYSFQIKAQYLEENKKVLSVRKKALEQRIINYEPFVEENSYRYRRTIDFIREDLKFTQMKREELNAINAEIQFLSDRQTFFTAANKNLKKYEVFLLETLNLLPIDYVKGLKENNMTALLRRCNTLFHLNRAIYRDLNSSSTAIRRLKTELDNCFSNMCQIQTEQSLLFPQLQRMAINCSNDLSYHMTTYAENYNILRQKTHTFGILLLGLNNVANKCVQMIKKGYYGEMDITVLPKIMMMESGDKFKKIGEFISSAIQILDHLRETRSGQ